jgi:hypothetical protein
MPLESSRGLVIRLMQHWQQRQSISSTRLFGSSIVLRLHFLTIFYELVGECYDWMDGAKIMARAYAIGIVKMVFIDPQVKGDLRESI